MNFPQPNLFFKAGIATIASIICMQGTCFADNAKNDLQEVRYDFDQTKLEAAPDSFHFLRSYVDFFYLTYKENKKVFSTVTDLSKTFGWCVGDAHAENFGILIQQDKTPLFTMNDIDDSGPCPVILDLFRFMVSTRLYSSEIKLDDLIASYVDGLKQDTVKPPTIIQRMMDESEKKGTTPSDKKVKNNRIIRESQMSEVSNTERQKIRASLVENQLFNPNDFEILDLTSTIKIGGGSGGLQRYEILIGNGEKTYHLEMKEETTPSIYPIQINSPDPARRLFTTIFVNQGVEPSKFFKVVTYNNKVFLVRPRFAGNIGVALNDYSKKENEDIIVFEAYSLGLIHSRSVFDTKKWLQKIEAVEKKDWQQEVELMADYFDMKFKQLKK